GGKDCLRSSVPLVGQPQQAPTASSEALTSPPVVEPPGGALRPAHTSGSRSGDPVRSSNAPRTSPPVTGRVPSGDELRLLNPEDRVDGAIGVGSPHGRRSHHYRSEGASLSAGTAGGRPSRSPVTCSPPALPRCSPVSGR